MIAHGPRKKFWLPSIAPLYGAAAGGGGGGSTTFSPTDKSSRIDLDATNLQATENGSTSDYVVALARATTGISSGKKYFRFKLTTAVAASTDKSVGFGIALASVTTSSEVGFVANSIGVKWNGNNGVVNGIYSGNTFANDFINNLGTGTMALNDYVDVALDMTNGQLWMRKGGTTQWNHSGADPTTNSGGVAVSAGTWFPAITLINGGAGNGVFADDASGSCPSGFTWLG